MRSITLSLGSERKTGRGVLIRFPAWEIDGAETEEVGWALGDKNHHLFKVGRKAGRVMAVAVSTLVSSTETGI